MTRETGYRVFGGELGVTDSYVDVDVVGSDSDGNIIVQDKNDSTREWPISQKKMRRLYAEDKIVGDDDIPYPTHKMWDVLDSIESVRTNNDLSSDVHRRLEEAAKNIFQSLLLV